MRIVHLVNELVDNGNGIVNVVVDLACTQASAGHEVTVVSRGGEFVDLVRSHGADHRTARFSSAPREAPAERRRLSQLLTELDPDVVHSHTLAPAGLAFAARGADRLRRRPARYRLVTTVHYEYQRGV